MPHQKAPLSRFFLLIGCLLQPLLSLADTAQQARALNDGQLLLQGVPEIPQQLITRLQQYQNVRSAGFIDWTPDGKGMYITTRFSELSQIHRVDYPGGARHQLTFFEEPLGEVTRQRNGGRLALTMDRGGSEFSQIFLLHSTVNGCPEKHMTASGK